MPDTKTKDDRFNDNCNLLLIRVVFYQFLADYLPLKLKLDGYTIN